MALHRIYKWSFFTIAIWRIDAEAVALDINELSAQDKDRLKNFKNEARKKQFLAARAALKAISDHGIKLDYSPSGAPRHPAFLGLSLSHNQDYAVAAISHQTKIGIDLESHREQMHKLKTRFLSEQELHALGEKPVPEQISPYWCAKEAIIKAVDQPELDLRKEIRIAPVIHEKRSTGKGRLRANGTQGSLDLYFWQEKDFCLCLCQA